MALLTNLWQRIWKTEDQQELKTPVDTSHEFTLFYKQHHIGTLRLENGIWSYQYSEYFKNAQPRPIAPIPDFRDVERVYRFRELHPFFLLRIPGLQQPAVKAIIARENIDPHSEPSLLKRFGTHTIANPFVLRSA